MVLSSDCASAVHLYFIPERRQYTEVSMENFVSLLIPALLLCVLVRVIMLPIRWFWKVFLNSACGFLCLWLMNSIAGFTGIYYPINAVTVVVAGFL